MILGIYFMIGVFLLMVETIAAHYLAPDVNRIGGGLGLWHIIALITIWPLSVILDVINMIHVDVKGSELFDTGISESKYL